MKWKSISFLLLALGTLLSCTEDSPLGISQRILDDPDDHAPWLTQLTQNGATIQVDWIDNVAGESGFSIMRREGDTGSFLQVGGVEADVMTWTDAGPFTDELVYYYVVRTTLASGGTDDSNEMQIEYNEP